MTVTPWGESSELRERRMQPGPGVPRDEVERNQRERLYGATVAVVAEKGYGKATITDLIEMAGVSRNTFYNYFADKEACFLATLELLLTSTAEVTRRGFAGGGSWRERAEAGLRVFIGALVAQPDAARICVVESDAAGPKAIAMVDATAAEFTAMVTTVYEEMHGQGVMPKAVLEGMVGGLRKLLQTRLHRRTESELIEVIPDLVDLAVAYRPPPRRLPERPPRSKVAPSAGQYVGIDEPAQRLERAAMAVIARDGFVDATMAAIAGEARVSLGTVYANFEDKSDLFDAALLRSRLRMAAAVTPAYLRAKTWPEAVVAVTRGILAFLEAEPDFTRLITVDIHGAGNAALESRDRALDSTRHFVEASGSYPKGTKPIVGEGIESVLYAMLAARARSRYKNLQGMAPLAIYVILTPFLGPEDAYRHAVE
jgi:AcrR family transcriptional regulator